MSTNDEIAQLNAQAQKDRDAAEAARQELAKKAKAAQDADLVKAKEAADAAKREREAAEKAARA